MVLVTLSPEGVASFRKLPEDVKSRFDGFLLEFVSARRLRLPGGFPSHQLEGSPDLWTLKVGAYRGIFRWDGREVRFIRFGHQTRVYYALPK